MFKNQKGIAQVLVLLIVLLGLGVGVYLVQQQTSLRSKASQDGTRIQFVDSSGNSIDKTVSRNVKVKVTFIPPSPPPQSPSPEPSLTPSPTPSPSSSPSPSPSPKEIPQPFTREWSVNWEKIPAGTYELSFAHSNITQTDPSVILPQPITVEVKEKATTEVKVSTDGKSHITTYYPDSSIPSGQLRVETVPGRGIKITVTAKSVLGINTARAFSPIYPTNFRLANTEKEKLSQGQEFEFSQNDQIVDFELEPGVGKKRVYAQFKIDGQWGEDSIVWAEIILEASQKIDLAAYFRDPEITKTHYLYRGLSEADKRKHPDWTPESPSGALWFEMINDSTWRQYNYNPADANRRCAYDEWSFDDNNVYYVNTTHGPACDSSGKTAQSVFEPPVVEFPRYWHESEGQKLYSGTSEHLDVQDGKEICRKKDEYNNGVLGWEEVAPGVNAIHIKVHSKTVSSNCSYDKDYINKVYEEHYWLAPLPVEGQPGKTAWGVKRAMGGNVEDQWAREAKGECNYSPDEYAWDEIAKLRVENNCPFYWDIWNDMYKKLPEIPPRPSDSPFTAREGMLRVETKPAVGANIIVKSSQTQKVVLEEKWGVNWEKLPTGKYTVEFSYPYSTIHNKPIKIPAKQEIDIRSGRTTEVVVDLTKGEAKIITH